MQDHFLKKPWYFGFAVLMFIIERPLEALVMQYFPEETITSFLDTSLTLKAALPTILFVFTLLVCIVIYVFQLKNKLKIKVSPDEMKELNEKLTTTVQRNEHVESLQAYQYILHNDNSLKYIKLNYLCGAANERIEINSIMQTYYYFTHSIYKKLSSISGYYNSYIKETDPGRRQDYHEDFKKRGAELCEILINKLNDLTNPNDIKECHCEMYRTLARILPAISENAIEWLLSNREVELALIKKKKTGILGSIILNGLYIFRNQNSIGKKERIYFTFPFDLEKRIIIIASINGACFPSESVDHLESYCKDFAAQICS